MGNLPQKKKLQYIKLLLLVVTIAIFIVGFLNWGKIYDWYRGLSYKPTGDMLVIQNSLGLTDEGEFLFNAVHPALNDAEDFNQNCHKDESDVAVLGCYTMGNIYIYDIDSSELKGIRELTTAHELLHAKWERMSDAEKRELDSILTQVFNENKDLLKDEIEEYGINERQEELYVRVGTEIKKLPEVLEKHYARIFRDQDKIVDFYNSYIKVFKELKARLEILKEEIESLKVQIDDKVASYEALVGQLEIDIEEFNNCANTIGCFVSEVDFYLERGSLLTKQDELAGLNDEINGLIDNYNAKIDEYNADVMESNKLQEMINSNNVPELLK